MVTAVVRAVRATAKNPLPEQVSPEHGFLTDLGFDSMTLALLALALEDELECSVLLDGWVSEHADPALLTVGSLASHLQLLVKDEQTAVQ